MLSFIKGIKDGEYMTRICACANNDSLFVSADSLYTNTMNSTQTTNNLKLSYNKNNVVALLGTSELFTSKGLVSIREIIQDFLNNNSDGNIQILYDLQNKLIQLCEYYQFKTPCLIMHFWKENNCFYMYLYDIRYPENNIFGTTGAIVNSPYKPVSIDNMKSYIFHNYIIEAGDGLKNNPLIEKCSVNKNLLNLTAGHVQKAILDSNIPTVGGNVYTVQLDLDGNINTFLNDKIHEW